MAVTGQNLSSNLVNVVFQLFDKDGDGRLSQREFITVMKDRIHRGYRVSLNMTPVNLAHVLCVDMSAVCEWMLS